MKDKKDKGYKKYGGLIYKTLQEKIMDKSIKSKWIEALRSGKYRQSINVKKDGYGFCCLGVLEDIRAKEEGVEWELCKTGIYHISFEGDLRSTSSTVVLNNSTAQWSGLGQQNPEMKVDGEVRTIGSMNDNLNMSFEEIAVLIEQQL